MFTYCVSSEMCATAQYTYIHLTPLRVGKYCGELWQMFSLCFVCRAAVVASSSTAEATTMATTATTAVATVVVVMVATQNTNGRIWCITTTSYILHFCWIFQRCNYCRFSTAAHFFSLLSTLSFFFFSLFHSKFEWHKFVLVSSRFQLFPFVSDLLFSLEFLFLSALIMIYKGITEKFIPVSLFLLLHTHTIPFFSFVTSVHSPKIPNCS